MSIQSKRLEAAKSAVEAEVGPGVVLFADSVRPRVRSIPTGSIGLDAAIGAPGEPRDITS